MKSLISILAVSLALAFTGPAFAGVEDHSITKQLRKPGGKACWVQGHCKEVPRGRKCRPGASSSSGCVAAGGLA